MKPGLQVSSVCHGIIFQMLSNALDQALIWLTKRSCAIPVYVHILSMLWFLTTSTFQRELYSLACCVQSFSWSWIHFSLHSSSSPKLTQLLYAKASSCVYQAKVSGINRRMSPICLFYIASFIYIFSHFGIFPVNLNLCHSLLQCPALLLPLL